MEDELWLRQHPWFRVRPATFKEFCTHPKYLGQEEVYRKVLALGTEITTGEYDEAVVIAGIGSGKSFLSQLLTLYKVYELFCMRNPYDYFGLSPDKPITCMNMGLSKTQARNVVFAGMRGMIEASPYMMSYINPSEFQKERVIFNRHNIQVVCGNSKETMPLGYNVYCAVLDEAAFYLDTNKRNVASDIYTSLQRRIVSRFGTEGLTIMISSPKYENDFIQQKFEESKKFANIFGVRLASWEMKDREKMSSETFDFVLSEFDDGTPKEVLKGIPVDYKFSFDQNPEKALRDFAALPSRAMQPFDMDKGIIVRNSNKKRTRATHDGHPITKEGQLAEWFTNYENQITRERKTLSRYYIHIDLGLDVLQKSGGRSDKVGFAMARVKGYKEMQVGVTRDEFNLEIPRMEKLPIVELTLYTQITAEGHNEIEFEKVRQLIYTIRDRGFTIGLISYDGWNSIDSRQLLEAKGLKTELLSIDRTLDPYNALKELLRGRLDYYISNEDNPEDDIFVREYEALEMLKSKKVDHQEFGSKDVTDAIAGACYLAIREDQKHTLVGTFSL